VLALALFMDMGGGRVMRKLAGTLAWAARGVAVTIPSEEALSNARARLGPEPLRLLFERVAGPLAGPDTPGGFWRGRRVVSLDGTTLDAQDTAANWERFGGPSTKDGQGRRLRGAFPQLRVVALAECASRALIAAAAAGYDTGEKTLTRRLLGRLGAGMLVLADRNFPGYELWRDAAGTGADLLWRVSGGGDLAVAAGGDGLAGGASRLSLYVGAADEDEPIKGYRLRDDPDGQLVLVVVPGRVPSDLAPAGGQPVPAPAAIADLLEEDDVRARNAALRRLRQFQQDLNEAGWLGGTKAGRATAGDSR